MRIAFVSYEYPPDTAYGGIATYVYQAAKMLRERGHQVEVFAASPNRAGTETENGFLVHRTNVKEQQKFTCFICSYHTLEVILSSVNYVYHN